MGACAGNGRVRRRLVLGKEALPKGGRFGYNECRRLQAIAKRGIVEILPEYLTNFRVSKLPEKEDGGERGDRGASCHDCGRRGADLQADHGPGGLGGPGDGGCGHCQERARSHCAGEGAGTGHFDHGHSDAGSKRPGLDRAGQEAAAGGGDRDHQRLCAF